MRPVSLFAIGVCGGAFAALLYLALDSARDVLSSTEASSGSTAQEAASSQASFDPGVPASKDSQDADLRAVLALESDIIRTAGVNRMARIRARQNGEAALAAADELPPDSRSAWVSAVAAEWAFLDPAGFFAYAEAADSIDDLIGGLEVLIATDPVRVFEIAQQFDWAQSPEIQALYLHAVRGMTARDPTGTIARVQGAATGMQRDAILVSIADAWSTLDAEAALTWATSVVPPATDALGKVIENAASRDLLRAYEMLQQIPADIVDAEALGSTLVNTALRGGQSAGSLASAFAARSGPDAAVMLSHLMRGWTEREPEDAVSWMTGNEAYLTDELTGAMVALLAFEDVTLAADLAARVPPGAQEQWLSAVASRYGQFDVEAGMNWLAKYEGLEAYDSLREQLLLGASVSSPAFVAEYIETSGQYFDQRLVQQTASRFAQQSPDAAAQWALQIEDPDHSEWALEGVINRWSQMDSPATEQWIMSQPRSAARDRLLDSMLISGAMNPAVDARTLFRAYDSNASAQRALAEYIFRATRLPSNMLDDSLSRAESLLELMTDPVFRQQAEAQIEAVKN